MLTTGQIKRNQNVNIKIHILLKNKNLNLHACIYAKSAPISCDLSSKSVNHHSLQKKDVLL